MTCRMAAAAALVLLTAGAAKAGTDPLERAAAPTLHLSALRQSINLTDAQAEALRTGIARTAVDHKFADSLTGSLGFLCGLHGPVDYTASPVRGADPQGKFLGAKLSLAFR